MTKAEYTALAVARNRKRLDWIRANDPAEWNRRKELHRLSQAEWRKNLDPVARAERSEKRRLDQLARYHTDVEYRRKRLEACKWIHKKRTYGVSKAKYEEMVVDQGGVCKLCGKPPRPNRALVIDHDHKTGKVRGLLHDACNRLLGMLGDNSDGLRAAADRLDGHQRKASAA